MELYIKHNLIKTMSNNLMDTDIYTDFRYSTVGLKNDKIPSNYTARYYVPRVLSNPPNHRMRWA